eukprot:423265-Amphidinium_carterae.1
MVHLRSTLRNETGIGAVLQCRLPRCHRHTTWHSVCAEGTKSVAASTALLSFPLVHWPRRLSICGSLHVIVDDRLLHHLVAIAEVSREVTPMREQQHANYAYIFRVTRLGA